MWKEFRAKCGGSKEGITFPEFDHGLRMYGLHLRKEVSKELFDSIDINLNGTIQIFEFADNLMGRWGSDSNSLQGIGAHEEALLSEVAAEQAVRRRSQRSAMDQIRETLKEEKAKRLAKSRRKKPARIPIWKRGLSRPGSARVAVSTSTLQDPQAAEHSRQAGRRLNTDSSPARTKQRPKSACARTSRRRNETDPTQAGTQTPVSNDATSRIMMNELKAQRRAKVRPPSSQSSSLLRTGAFDHSAGGGTINCTGRSIEPPSRGSEFSSRPSSARMIRTTSPSRPSSRAGLRKSRAYDQTAAELDRELTSIGRDVAARRTSLGSTLHSG